MRPNRRQAAFSLPAAIFLITALAVLGIGVTRMFATGMQSVVSDVLSTRAFHAAESGAQWYLPRIAPIDTVPALQCTTTQQASVTFPTSGALASCSAQVECQLLHCSTNADDEPTAIYRLISTGQCGSGEERAARQILLEVQSEVGACG